MIDYWMRQLEFSRWAHLRWIEDLKVRENPCAEIQRDLAHIVAAETIWLARLQGKGQPCPVWPEWSLEEIELHLSRTREGWAQVLQQPGFEGSSTVRYQNSQEVTYESTIEDILNHLVIHGGYHRGQMALKARQNKQEPPAVDFIVFAREGH